MINKRKKYLIAALIVLAAIAAAGVWLYNPSVFQRQTVRKDALQVIRERGYIIALTDRNTLNYHVLRGAPMGYQFELLQSFGEFMGLPVKMIASDDIAQLDYLMDHHAADILALDLPVSREGKKKVRFSDPVGETRLVLVRKRPAKGSPEAMVTSPDNFPSDTVFVRANPYMTPLYHQFYRKTGKRAILRELSGISQEELIVGVAKGKYRYAICHENVAMVLHRNYPQLDISLLAFPLFTYSWGINHHSDSLQAKVNEWLTEVRSSGKLKYIYLSYFQNNRINNSFRSDYFSVTGSKLSPFDDAIRSASRIVAWDWRLVASLVYQESNFQQGLTSSRNAHGLMQLMPETARKFGVDSASAPSGQIRAGVKYLRYINELLPAEITDPVERISFTLATYNVGIGKVLRAREKAGKYGRDMNRWNGHVDYYLSRKSRKDPVGEIDTTDNILIGIENEGFVNEVISRYFHYRNLVK